MKTKIKLILIILISFIGIESMQAQSAHNRRKVFGDFFGGMTLATMDIEGGNQYKKHKIGFMMGGNLNYKFYHNLQLQTGFYLIKKGSVKHQKTRNWLEGEMRLETTDLKQTVDANYIQVPLNIGFEVPIAKNWYVNAHAGLFAAYGFKGKKHQTGYVQRDEHGAHVNLGEGKTDTFENDAYKRWDYGVGGSVGIVYDFFILRFQYDHGLANVATNALGNEWKTRSYTIAFGFRF